MNKEIISCDATLVSKGCSNYTCWFHCVTMVMKNCVHKWLLSSTVGYKFRIYTLCHTFHHQRRHKVEMGAFIAVAVTQISVNSTTNSFVAQVYCDSSVVNNITFSANVTSGPAVIEDFRAQPRIGFTNDYFLILSISEGTSVESTIEWEFTCIEENDSVGGTLTVSPDPSQVIFTEFEEEYCVSPDTPLGTRLFRVEAVVSVEVMG